MHDFTYTILNVFSRAVGPAIIAMIVGVFLWVKIQSKVKGGSEPSLRQIVKVALLMGYLGGLVTITLFLRTAGDSRIQWHLFRAFREAWNAFTFRAWMNPLLNIGMFVPLGVLLPLVAKPFRRWYLTLAVGAGGSLLIETIQYVLDLGSADVDDLFCDTLGTMLGFCLCMAVLSIVEKKPGRCAAYAVLPVLSVAVLVGTFVIYYTQPYGNIADAPAFAANTKDVEWVLECELSNEAGTAGIYWAEPFTKETCDEFALAFAQRRGVDTTDRYFFIEYDDDTAIYSNSSTFYLKVEYSSRAYSYKDYRTSGLDRGTTTEADLRAALSELGIQVPEKAEFVDEGDGAYTFRADHIEDDGILTDGELRCSVVEGGALRSVENEFSVSAFYGDAPVISQREAYSKLCRGLFSHGSWFEGQAPKEVHVLSCDLEYIVDSKGYYQPVYMFELEGLDPSFVLALTN